MCEEAACAAASSSRSDVVLNCHCSKRRKQHGAAFRSRARVRIGDFKWPQGEEFARFYQSSPGFSRGFCGAGGSPISASSGYSVLRRISA
jgi:hypothetical protein